MRLNRRSKFNVLLVALIFSGCATFEPGFHYRDIMRDRQPTVTELREGLENSVEEFITPKKSLQAFDADIAPYGVLALLLRVENKGPQHYRLQRKSIKAFLGEQPLVPLSGKEAANQAATSEYAGKALVSTLAAGPFALLWFGLPTIASLTHTASVNAKIEQHFGTLELTDTFLKPNKTVAGLVYFKLPDNAKRLERLAVEVEPFEEKSEKQLSFRFSLPTFELSAPVSAPIGEVREEK
ncbi:MAG: hypothetical protein ACREBU_16325 [Nitrososphaera sp.]